MAAMHLQNALHNSSTNSHLRILTEIAADYRGFRAGFRAKTEQRLAQDVATLEVSDTYREPVFKRRGTGAFSRQRGGRSAVQRMRYSSPQ